MFVLTLTSTLSPRTFQHFNSASWPPFLSLFVPPVPVRVFPTADPSLQPGQQATTPTLLLHHLPLFPLPLHRYLPQACGALLLLPFLLYRSSSSSRSSRLPLLLSRLPRGCFTRPLHLWRLPSTPPPRPVSNRSWKGANPWALAPSQTAPSCLLPHLPLLCPSLEHGAPPHVPRARHLCRPSPQQEQWPHRRPTPSTMWGPRDTIQPICHPSATHAVSCWKPSEKVWKLSQPAVKQIAYAHILPNFYEEIHDIYKNTTKNLVN